MGSAPALEALSWGRPGRGEAQRDNRTDLAWARPEARLDRPPPRRNLVRERSEGRPPRGSARLYPARATGFPGNVPQASAASASRARPVTHRARPAASRLEPPRIAVTAQEPPSPPSSGRSPGQTGKPLPPLVIGLAGGIASGKSAAARLLAGDGGVVIDADALAHEVLAEPETAAFVSQTFGPEALDAEGRPDRAVLAQRVFREPQLRAALEAFTHPRIRARIRASLEDARAAGTPRIVLDVPLLFENDREHQLVAECDRLVFVAVEREERERRARETRGWGPGELARREAAQLPLSEKEARADHVLHNDGTLAELAHQVHQLLESLRPR